MKIATQTRCFIEDYAWSAPDDSFKSIADQDWMRWHTESYLGAWFGLSKQNGRVLFLSGKIPTERQDRVHRHIVDTIVLQPETGKDEELIISLTADLLTGRQDINSSQSAFTKWVDEICVAAAEEGKYIFPEVTFCSTPVVSGDHNSIGRFEYPLDSPERNNVANALSNLLSSNKDFAVGCIHCPTSKIIDKVCNSLAGDAQIAIFSAKTTEKKEIAKKEIPEEEMPQNPRMKIANYIVIAILIIFCTILGMKNSSISKDLVKLQNELQATSEKLDSITSENDSLTKEITVLKAENEQLKGQIKALPKP